ncbi:MAG: hypothetical protein ACFFB2_00385 [Promethearchaeota archaeon]
MNCKALIISRKKSHVLLLLMLCLTNHIFLEAKANNQTKSNQVPQIKIEQGEIPLFGGIQSIRATIGDSRIGILYGTAKNPKPLYLFSEFSQKIATVQIFNRRGTLEQEIELEVQNIFAFRLDTIIEFLDRNNDGLYSILQDRLPPKMVNLSTVTFEVSKSNITPSDSEDFLNYAVNFTATNVSYQMISEPPRNSILESLCFSFKLAIEQDQINISEVPIISIYPRDLGFEASITSKKGNIVAERVKPRLKFSCNIIGWDYSSAKSKLLLKNSMLTHEQILTPLGKISGRELTRESLKSTDIFSRLAFNIEQGGQIRRSYLDHNENRTNEYSAKELRDFQISLSSKIRNFLNFTWQPTLNVDGIAYPVVFQLITSGEANFPVHQSKSLASLYLIGGFIFPQGEEIQYDPEVHFEELNPILSLSIIPNRSILEGNSLIILVSGFFVGILIFYRQLSYRRK